MNLIIGTFLFFQLFPTEDVTLLCVHQLNVTEYKRIVLKPDLIFDFKNESYRIAKSSLRSQHSLPVTIFFENGNTFYFVTSVDHPSNLIVNFNYNVNFVDCKSKFVVKYDLLVMKSDSHFEETMEITFKNLNFSSFLLKERSIVNYFYEELDDKVVVSNIETKGDNLKVILANTKLFSEKAFYELDLKRCSSELKIADLEIEPCSIRIREIKKNVTNHYQLNTVNLDLDVTVS